MNNGGTGTLAVNSLAFSPDGTTLACAAGLVKKPGGEVSLWRVSDGARLQTYALALGESGYSVAFTPHGSRLAYGTSDAVVVARNPYAPPAGRADTALAVQPAGGPIGKDVTLFGPPDERRRRRRRKGGYTHRRGRCPLGGDGRRRHGHRHVPGA